MYSTTCAIPKNGNAKINALTKKNRAPYRVGIPTAALILRAMPSPIIMMTAKAIPAAIMRIPANLKQLVKTGALKILTTFLSPIVQPIAGL
jgi:hypothetical protein